MRFRIGLVFAIGLFAVAQNANAQHKGDPRLDEIARRYEARFKSIEDRLAALEGKKPAQAKTPPAAPVPPVATQTVMQAFTELVPVRSCSRGGCSTSMEYRTVWRPVDVPVTQAEPAPPALTAPAVVLPAPLPEAELKVKEKRNKTVIKSRTSAAFEEVNAHRARRGLRPFVWDDGLARAAEKCAAYRAQTFQHGHVNDFAFLDPGVECAATGAEAGGQSYNAPGTPGWFTCCTEDGYTFAGAGSATDANGQRYMSLFVR